MSVGLLDANVLIALAWPSHLHHSAAHRWFSENRASGWATCPITQCAFVRAACNSKIVKNAVEPREATEMLQRVVDQKHHVFWEEDIEFVAAAVPKDLLTGHRQVTDAYLLGLAVHRGGKLVTFDRNLRALLPADGSLADSLEIVSLG